MFPYYSSWRLLEIFFFITDRAKVIFYGSKLGDFEQLGFLFFCLDTKETKNQVSIFYSVNHATHFQYRDHSRSFLTRCSLPSPNANALHDLRRIKYEDGPGGKSG